MSRLVAGCRRARPWTTAVVVAAVLGGCTPSIEKLWEFPVSSPIYSTPLVTDNFVIFGSESGTLHAVDHNGQARWTFQAPSGEIFSHPQSSGKLVYFGATNQKFYAVDMRGDLKWHFATSERIKSDPAVVEGVAYCTSYDGHVYALKADNGRKIWQFPPPEKKQEEQPEEAAGEKKEQEEQDPAEEKPAATAVTPGEFSYAAPVVRDGVLYVGNLDGYLYAIKTADGSLKWRFKAGEGITSTAWVEDGVVYFGSKDDHVYAVDAATGDKVIWKHKTGGDVLSSPRIADGVLWVGSNDTSFYALDAKTGEPRCSFKAKGPIISYGVFYKNLVLFGGGQGDGNFYAIHRDSCQPFFSYETGYKIESDPTLDGDRVYVTSGDRKLYAFKINKTQ